LRAAFFFFPFPFFFCPFVVDPTVSAWFDVSEIGGSMAKSVAGGDKARVWEAKNASRPELAELEINRL